MSEGISRIEKEFIFNFLIKNRVKFEIKIGDCSAEAYILEQGVKELKIDIISDYDSTIIGFNTEISVYFYFQNTHHTFNSVIIKAKGNIALIKNPDSIVRNLLRKYERVKLDGSIFVEFDLESDLLPLDYPKCNICYYPDKPPVSADFSEVKIDLILNRFKEKMNNIVSHNKILMLRNNKPKNIFEEIVVKNGKILYFPNTHSDYLSKQIDSNFEILTRVDFSEFETEKNNTPPIMMNKTLSKYLMDLSKNDIFSFCLVPILYRNYVVGLIYLIKNQTRHLGRV